MHLDPHEDEHRCYQHTEIFKLNLQHRFYIKDLNTNNRVQTHSGSLKLSSKYNTITATTIQGELHILPTDVTPTCPIFTGKTGPTRRSNLEEAAVQSRTHRSPRSPQGHNLLRMVTTTTLSILILSKAYPTLGILSHYLDMQGFLALEFFC